MARFVLVHGAFGGAWCWEPIVAPLEAAGHSVEAIDLPGSGDDPTPAGEVTLDAYAERICSVLGEREEPAILVGHSAGGMAITQAAARCPQRIVGLAYVAAFLPQDGQSLVALTQLPEGAASAGRRATGGSTTMLACTWSPAPSGSCVSATRLCPSCGRNAAT